MDDRIVLDVEGSLELGEQLCFDLYSASRAMTGLYRVALEELGLTYPQYLVMLVLWERDGVSIKELADELGLDYGTLSPLLKRLERAGVITRARRSDDERSVEISPTATGWALRAGAEEIPAQIAEATGLSRAEREALRDALRTLRSSAGSRALSPAC